MQCVVRSVPRGQPADSSAAHSTMLPAVSRAQLPHLQYLAWTNSQQPQKGGKTERVGGSSGAVRGIKTMPVTGSSCIFNGIMAFTLQFFNFRMK